VCERYEEGEEEEGRNGVKGNELRDGKGREWQHSWKCIALCNAFRPLLDIMEAIKRKGQAGTARAGPTPARRREQPEEEGRQGGGKNLERAAGTRGISEKGRA